RLRLARLPLKGQPYEQATFEAAKADPVETAENPGSGGDEDEGPIGDDASGAAALPDFTGESMREVLLMGSRLGIRVEVEGSGFAVEQSPGPGVDLSRVEKVKVRFNPPM
ncbi:MAG: PASTA domain-containing protein, partial [Desulfobacteraceae bacterium]